MPRHGLILFLVAAWVVAWSAAICAQAAEPEYNLLANGSFEFWSHCAVEVLPAILKEGPKFETDDPLIPTRWMWRMGKSSRLSRSANAHAGQFAISIVGGGELAMGKLEVVPGAKYSFGVWAKGSGDITVQVLGEAPEGHQELGKVSGKADKEWKKIGSTLEIPGHIRLVWLKLLPGSSADMALDDAYIAAPLDQPYNADDVLTKKPQRDDNTLLLLDCEKDDSELRLEGKSRISGPDGGRFGRGLRMDGGKMQGMLVTKPFKLPSMPEEGTIECWLSADEMPMLTKDTWNTQHIYLQIRSAATDTFILQAGGNQTVSGHWRIADGNWKGNNLETSSEISSWRMHKGEWHHVAVTWDKSAWRIYFDGVLSGVSTKPPLKWWAAPMSITMGSEYKHLCWSGGIDEIRISKIKRYGPFTPKGAKPNPLPVTEAPGEDKPTAETPKVDFSEARKKMLGAIPPTRPEAFEATLNADGDYVYEATSAKPLVEGSEFNFKLEPDSIVKGLTTTAIVGRHPLEGTPQLNGIYWKLKGVKPGQYWVGLVFRTGADGKGAEAPIDGRGGPFDIYLNGREVPCSTLSDPVQIAPGVWFAEAQAAGPESLKEGDELAMVVSSTCVVPPTARLLLHGKEPRRGVHRLRINPGPNTWNHGTTLGISADATFVAGPGKPLYRALFMSSLRQQQWMETPEDFLRGPDGQAIAHCCLANPLPVPVEVDYECVVKGYYLQEAGRDAARLTLAPHSYITRKVPFKTTVDDPAYSIHATLKAAKRPDLGWPAYDEFAFFPGLRHLVPWLDSFSFVEHRRVIFKQPVKDERQRLALFGSWEVALTADLDPPMPLPADLKFKPCEVPWRLEKSDEPKANSAYLRRKFVLPETQVARVARFIVDTVSSECTAYINGKKVGTVRGTNAPLIGEATALLRPGENEVVLVVRSKLAITNPKYVNRESPTESFLYMDAPGNCDNKLAVGASWISNHGVWLEFEPEVATRDVKVETSVRNKTIGAHFTLVNGTKDEARLRLKVSVEDARKPVLTICEQELTLRPGEPKPLEFVKEWRDPRLWSLQDPNLYVLAVEVMNATSGKRLDLARERFGFRETWIQAGQVYFNGQAVRLKELGGNGFSFPSLDNSRKCNVQVERGARDPDFSDEVGTASTDLITGLLNTPSKYNVESDAFWETCRANAQAALRRKWNHPSILSWDLSNEWFTYAPYSGADMDVTAKRFKGLSDAVEKLDPTRWTFFNGDGDINGLHNTNSTHYMPEGARSFVGGFDFAGHSTYFPDGVFWRALDRDFQPGEELELDCHQHKKWRIGSKALMDTENIWLFEKFRPPGTGKFVGEDTVISSGSCDCIGPMIWMWKQDYDCQRDLGMAILANNDGPPGTATRCHLLQTFIMPDVAHHGFAGQKFERFYSLLNDLFRPAKLKLKWKLVEPGGKAVVDDADERELNACETKRGSLSFTLPKVTRRTLYTLQLRLESECVFVCGEDRDIEVWPDVPIAAGDLARNVMLYDPREGTAKALKSAGVVFQTVKTLAAPAGDASAWTFVIGEGALDEAGAKQSLALGKFVEAGGRVVVLAQTITPQGLPAKTMLESREWVSQPYVRLATHPVLDGITTWDLHFWAPDRVSARGAYSKPNGGAAIPLVDSGEENGLEWVQMMEMYRGKGLYLLCQMSLVSDWGQEPLARELLARILRYTGGKDPFLAPVQRLRWMTEKDSILERRLLDVGVAGERIPSDAGLDLTAPTLVQAGIVPTAAQRAAWKASLGNGATLVVVAARPEDSSWLSDLADQAVRVTVPRYRMWEGRGCRNGFDALTAGLSHMDLFWKRYHNIFHTADDPDYLIEQFQDSSVECAGGRELVYPGALVEVKIGKGRLILDQRRWMTTNETLTPLAKRNLSALALGLNVSIAPITPVRELPVDIAYRPIDLAPYANRALADDVAEDGKGGWSDQGPDADLRTFPTGKQSFHGIPFIIGAGPKSIVTLDTRDGKKDRLLESTIPVGYPVEGFYFIDGAAYGAGVEAVYQIQYADGTSVDISLKDGENIRDWINKNTGDFQQEKGTKTVVVWTGSCKMFSPITVYMMRWVNPKPEVPVKAVRFVNSGMSGVPSLIGLTAVVKKDSKETTAEIAKAQDLLKQAQRALDSGKVAEGKALLKQAISASPALDAAHQALADLCEKGGKEEETLDAYRQWTQAGARTPLPWNRLGEILEKRKDYKGALEAYKQSLKIEWNQPPIGEAKSRMEKLVGQ